MDLDRVTSLLNDTARDIILPRFRRLAAADVERKQSVADPDDVVTVVDREVEAALERELLALAPGSMVIGEEATHADTSILSRLSGEDPVWLIDPIDGTRNFVAGDDGFGIMLGYAADGRTLCAWILLPARNQLFVAEAGSGAFLNGQRLRVPQREERVLRGFVHGRYMPRELKAAADRAAAGQFHQASDPRAAAIEYTEILQGSRDFAVYYRLYPWDHVAPSLILEEGGGVSVHADGRRYGPRSSDQVTIVAGNAETAESVRGWFSDGLAALRA